MPQNYNHMPLPINIIMLLISYYVKDLYNHRNQLNVYYIVKAIMKIYFLFTSC